ncbi:hypothetical protein [Micromonospora sp. NPDC000668]|uniref:hypothetical protein n=1 Tax=Micromonospora sp. NPDC000668 TaxID=3364219 RepID=UPI00367A485E
MNLDHPKAFARLVLGDAAGQDMPSPARSRPAPNADSYSEESVTIANPAVGARKVHVDG